MFMNKAYLIVLLVFASFAFAARPAPGPVVSYTIDLAQGWNLISVPVLNPEVVEDTCGSNGGLRNFYDFDPTDAHYKRLSSVTAAKTFRGIWYKTDQVCSITVSGNQYNDLNGLGKKALHLKKGWNMIGSASVPLLWNDVKGTCNVVKGEGPFWFDAFSSTSFWLSDTLEPGKGYFIKVDRNCQMGG